MDTGPGLLEMVSAPHLEYAMIQEVESGTSCLVESVALGVVGEKELVICALRYLGNGYPSACSRLEMLQTKEQKTR